MTMNRSNNILAELPLRFEKPKPKAKEGDLVWSNKSFPHLRYVSLVYWSDYYKEWQYCYTGFYPNYDREKNIECVVSPREEWEEDYERWLTENKDLL